MSDNLLLAQMRRDREKRVTVGEWTFVVRRPTDLEITEFKGKLDQRKILERFVLDWSGLLERDLIRNGTDREIEFDRAIFLEFIEDKPDLWNVITKAVTEAYQAHKEATEESVKN